MSDEGLHDPFEVFTGATGNSGNERPWTQTHFDSMLEILPENLDIDVASRQETKSPTSMPFDFPEEPNKLANEPAFHLHKENENNSDQKSRPIDIVPSGCKNTQSSTAGQLMGNDLNLQNGEIAQLWDFNVDEFMMTPSEHSDSATISAPSSFNSEHFTPGSSITGFHTTSMSNIHSITQSNPANSHIHNNWNHMLHQPQHHDFANSNLSSNNNSNSNNNNNNSNDNPTSSSAYSSQHHSLFQNSNSSQSTIKADEYYNNKPQMSRRSSSRSLLLKNDIGEDGALPFSSHTTTNLVKKNSTMKALPTNSLPQYRRGSSTNLQSMNGVSTTNGAKTNKPPTQCYNCKTLKTPLWRRDPEGNTLCNACGLFQKLHGTMRPLSLKSDIIKKRNTKKRTKKDEKAAASTSALGSNNQSLLQAQNRSKQQSQSENERTNLSERPQSKSHKSGPISQSNQTFNQPPALNQNSLNHHNKKVPGKSRRSSTSSSTSSKSSSSRSVVPILPKPSPGSRDNSLQQFQYQMQIQMQVSQPNSAASSPRYSNSPRFYPTSPSTGIGVVIPRRKSSRTVVSQSSSFMAQSLQQLQHQQHQQHHSSNTHSPSVPGPINSQNTASGGHNNPNGSLSTSNHSSSNATISAPNSWANHSVSQNQNVTSPPSSSKSPFELFASSNSQAKKSHKSLLSQQLQNSSSSPSNSPSFTDSASSGNLLSQTPPHHHAQSQLSSTPLATASPRSSYVDTLQQQRGIIQYEQQQQQHHISRRKNPSSRQSSSSLFDATPPSLPKSKKESSLMDDLDWLKFGM